MTPVAQGSRASLPTRPHSRRAGFLRPTIRTILRSTGTLCIGTLGVRLATKHQSTPKWYPHGQMHQNLSTHLYAIVASTTSRIIQRERSTRFWMPHQLRRHWWQHFPPKQLARIPCITHLLLEVFWHSTVQPEMCTRLIRRRARAACMQISTNVMEGLLLS